jgi:hypothetical protein
VRHPRKLWITDDSQRGQAGVEAEALPCQDVERPHRAVVDRPLRCAKPQDGLDSGRPQRVNASIQLIGKRVWRQLIDRTVQVSMRSDLVSCLDNLLDEPGVPERNPAENEERGANPVPIQEIEQLAGVRNDPARKLTPPVGTGQRLDAADVKPLFNVDGQAIANHVKRQPARRDDLPR